ncbi:nucleoside triphosphate pyrophosphohydrolase [Alicyclobacillus fodiniaquatilis]|jgi:tetrapyrrole methylase family protein/MazG family protein|uniref:Nucleoside triphosphate pyrophosphohydrolase n=1 Tax=Alicyclobacillus fodiniaquatilis TaxID=1661150 RepID=A0ABW4JC25_9BACL
MAVIHIVGLGPGDKTGLPMGTYQLLKSGLPVVLRTCFHPVVAQLESEGLTYTSFDHLYENGEAFEEIYAAMANALVTQAKANGDLIYAVPGHPLVAEQSVQNLLQAEIPGVEVNIGPGQSFLDVTAARLRIDPIDGLLLLDGTSLTDAALNAHVHTLIAQVYQTSIAAEVKLTLMEVYPDDYEITVLRAVAVEGQERIVQIPLYELDRLDWIDHLTTVYVPPLQSREQLVRDPWQAVQIVRDLRAPDGCPWDREQTHESLRKYVLEEAYEVASAIDEQDWDHLCEELGDLLLQVLLHAQIAEEYGEFTVRDVFSELSTKLIRRHPHVFASSVATDVTDANALWDAVKRAEKEEEAESPSLMAGVKMAGPALMVAADVQKAAAKVGFDFKQVKDVLEKIKEEMNELEAELATQPHQRAVEEELGDLLFSCVNLARFFKCDAEALLMQATRKFTARFEQVEMQVKSSGKNWGAFTSEALDVLWNQAKIALMRKN